MFFWLYVFTGLQFNPRIRLSVLTLAALLLCYEAWFVEFRDLIASNAQMTLLTTIEPTLNLLLTNTLNKYHPFIFYSSLAGLLIMFMFS